MSGVDPSLKGYVEPLESAVTQLEEVARELRRYGDCVQSSPERLQEVEERLELLRRLKTRYGPTLDDVVQFKERMRQELETLEDRERERHRIDEELRRVEGEAGRMAEELSMTRQQCAQELIELVNRELAELTTPWARFGIRLSQEENPAGLPAWGSRYSFSHLGLDRVEFLATTNPGEPMRPLADIASGGEICRFMLALKSALRRVDPIPTLVFDEIDAGIGGRNAHVVGRKLAMLAEGRQVICITHLPQVASFGQSHYRVVKATSGGQALTCLQRLAEGSREEELAEMLGGAGDASMVATARRLLNRAGEP
jgi:DNA repair protein RecN (Recombination protein N)